VLKANNGKAAESQAGAHQAVQAASEKKRTSRSPCGSTEGSGSIEGQEVAATKPGNKTSIGRDGIDLTGIRGRITIVDPCRGIGGMAAYCRHTDPGKRKNAWYFRGSVRKTSNRLERFF